jgi:uncharacterized protein YbaA (DUF1428 family)
MKKGGYVDGFIISIPTEKTVAYKKIAGEAKKVWMKFGALDYKECIGDDLAPDTGGMKASSFPKMAKPKEGEAVWFSFIVFKSRKHRDEVNKKVMAYFDKKYGEGNMDMPFDMKRFAYGGFKVQVGA